MKRISILAIAFIFSALSLTSCQKDNMGMSSRVFKGVIVNSAKSELSGLNVVWDAADAVIIANGTDHARYTATNINGTTCDFQCAVGEDVVGPPFYAMHPADNYVAHNRMTLSAVQQYRENNIENSPMYAASNTNVLYFHNLCGVLKLVLQKANTTVYSINITTDKRISGEFDIQAVVENGETCHQIEAGNESTNTSVTLHCGANGTDISTEKEFYIFLPAGNYTQFDITISANDQMSTKLRLNESSVTFDRNYIKTIERRNGDLVFTKDYYTPGDFSIDNSHQVFFAKGNLFYNKVNNTEIWTIADHQYDYYTTNNNNHQDKFCWPDSMTHFGTARIGQHPVTQTGCHHEFTDWGTIDGISGFDANTWRTLSFAEWHYLLFERRSNGKMTNNIPEFSKCRFTFNNGETHDMLVIYPDNFPAQYLIRSQQYNRSEYEQESWEWTNQNEEDYNMLNSLGCAMLPTAGVGRNRDNVNQDLTVGEFTVGRYASSTTDASNEYYVTKYYLNFVYNGYAQADANAHDDICLGHAVRLVRNNY